ncbi:MAG: sigma-54 dependent transcriptional regulator [Pseudomonadota bacterium]
MNNKRVLIVEDTPTLAMIYQDQLEKAGFETDLAETAEQALKRLQEDDFVVMLLDLQLPDSDGCTVLDRLSESKRSPATIIITAHGSINKAVEAMRLGAQNFLMKPVSEAKLIAAVENAIEADRIVRTSDQVAITEASPKKTVSGLIGDAPVMQNLSAMIGSMAPSMAPVFITGESGTGKEVCAEAIHRSSPRAKGPFMAVNCAAIPKDLIESELFGHKKGSFTGATSDRKGAVMSASGGTLFLDEICEMDISLQAKLLRFLQTGQIQRVGDDAVFDADVRIVCATNRIPVTEVAEGRFREDLYYRLHVLALQLPALRERGNDVVKLAQHFLRRAAEVEGKAFNAFSTEAQEWLLKHPWPGNVRQLENLIRAVVVLNTGDAITEEMLSRAMPPIPLASQNNLVGTPGFIVPQNSSSAAGIHANSANSTTLTDTSMVIDFARPFQDIERDIIERAIDYCQGSLPNAARLLGMSPSTLYRKREAWEKAPDKASA